MAARAALVDGTYREVAAGPAATASWNAFRTLHPDLGVNERLRLVGDLALPDEAVELPAGPGLSLDFSNPEPDSPGGGRPFASSRPGEHRTLSSPWND
jgi:hypothetical protein